MASTRVVSYWTSTGIIALAFLSGGLAYLAGVEETLRGMAELGYPAYFVTILGVWKTLGAVALVVPGLPRLKEWAYAGIAFDLIGAAASHAAVGHPAVKVAAPLVVLAIAAVSWALASQRRSTEAVRRPLEGGPLEGGRLKEAA
ncbi:MAG TPA: DoxX family protein [Candidatus Eisenbacteria bacterium]|nr:DoxX family protein [Candidatus Eisenbacteria bacterium]